MTRNKVDKKGSSELCELCYISSMFGSSIEYILNNKHKLDCIIKYK